MITLREPRILFLILAAIIFARSLGGALPWFLLYSLVGLVLLARAWAGGIGRELFCHYTVGRRTATAGESVAVEVRLGNESMWPAVWLRAVDRTAPGQPPALDTTTGLGPQATKVLRYHLPSLRRGRYRPGPLTLTWGDPFGFFGGRRVVTGDWQITVYPRVARLSALELPARQPFGSLRTREHAFQDPSHLAEVRPYRNGDHLKLVHWRTTARRGRLFVKEYELTASAELHIALDLQRAAYAGEESPVDLDLLDAAVAAAAAVADYAARRGFNVGLFAHGARPADVPCGSGHRRVREIMEVLTTVDADGAVPLAELLVVARRRLPGHAAVFAVTPAPDDDLVAELLALRRAGFRPGLCLMVGGGGGGAALAAKLREAGVAVWLVAPGERLDVALTGDGGARRRPRAVPLLAARGGAGARGGIRGGIRGGARVVGLPWLRPGAGEGGERP